MFLLLCCLRGGGSWGGRSLSNPGQPFTATGQLKAMVNMIWTSDDVSNKINVAQYYQLSLYCSAFWARSHLGTRNWKGFYGHIKCLFLRWSTLPGVLHKSLAVMTPSTKDPTTQNYCEASGIFLMSILCHSTPPITSPMGFLSLWFFFLGLARKWEDAASQGRRVTAWLQPSASSLTGEERLVR